MIINLDTADDPRIAAYRAVRDRDLIRADRFIVEGAIALERLLTASRFPVESLLLAENRVEPLAPILAHLPPDIPVYVTPQSIMDGVTGFPIHRGILALAKRTPAQTPEQLIASLPTGPLTLLVLIGLSNHDNVGGCFRNAAALGADAVLLDETSCDPLYRKSIRVSSGAALSLPFAHAGTGADIIAALIAAGVTPWALSPSGGEPLIKCEPPSTPCARPRRRRPRPARRPDHALHPRLHPDGGRHGQPQCRHRRRHRAQSRAVETRTLVLPKNLHARAAQRPHFVP